MSGQFCERCDVSMDLHPWPDDEDDRGCDVAESKARLLDDFNRIFSGRALGGGNEHQ